MPTLDLKIECTELQNQLDRVLDQNFLFTQNRKAIAEAILEALKSGECPELATFIRELSQEVGNQ